jgi:flagellar motor switch protein FliM
MEGIIVKILGNLREAWQQVIDLRPRLSVIETNPQFAQIVPQTEMVILVTLETRIGDIEGMMNFCIPYLTLEPIISKLSAQFMYSSVRRGMTTENLNTLKKKLDEVAVIMVAEYGRTKMNVRDILSIRQGDLIRLDSVRAGDALVLNVGNRMKFLCKPGLVGKKVAVQVVKKLGGGPEDEAFEELEGGI